MKHLGRRFNIMATAVDAPGDARGSAGRAQNGLSHRSLVVIALEHAGDRVDGVDHQVGFLADQRVGRAQGELRLP